ncbi:MAG: hypothetical protein IJE66_04100 [Akkermansia sp.]|nr:hypothetical protein [Akkermansia sp.]
MPSGIFLHHAAGVFRCRAVKVRLSYPLLSLSTHVSAFFTTCVSKFFTGGFVSAYAHPEPPQAFFAAAPSGAASSCVHTRRQRPRNSAILSVLPHPLRFHMCPKDSA